MSGSQAIAHVRSSDGEEQSLPDHLTGTGTLASFFALKLGLPRFGELVGMLHDLGKYSADFQAYLRSAAGLLDPDKDEDYLDPARHKGRIDHSTAGAQVVWEALASQGPLQRVLAQLAALCIASHHSGLIDCLAARDAELGEDLFARRMTKPPSASHRDEAWRSADASIRARIEGLLADPGLVAEFEDLLRSVTAPSKEVAANRLGLIARFLFSCLVDADRCDTSSFMRTFVARDKPDWAALADRLEAHLHGMPDTRAIDVLRRDISAHCMDAAERPTGLFTLTVPTGGGKTLSGLRFALHHARERGLDRVMYVVPFTAIIDQNARVVRDILDPDGSGNLVLEHHSNLLPEARGLHQKLLAEGWEAPVVFTTMVQVLETLFAGGTRGARRMHRLGRSVLIFDEIQMLPLRCVHLFANAVNFLVEQCGSTVVLCTATQPLLDRVDLARGAIRRAPDAEMMPDVAGLFGDLKRVDILDQQRDTGWGAEDVAALAFSELERTGSCLVVTNTKAAARTTFDLCQVIDAEARFHLSTAMCPAHRRDALAGMVARLKDGRPVTCVSTQVIEAGVDISFGSVIRHLAGLDSIAQAAGRCNRHGETAVAAVHVVNPRHERLGPGLADIEAGRRATQRVFRDYADDPTVFDENVIGPQAMERYYEYYFFERRREMSYPLSSRALGHDATLLDLLSRNVTARGAYRRRHGADALPLAQSFMTAGRLFEALDTPTEGVVVPYGDAGKAVIDALDHADDIDTLALDGGGDEVTQFLGRLVGIGAGEPGKQLGAVLVQTPGHPVH